MVRGVNGEVKVSAAVLVKWKILFIVSVMKLSDNHCTYTWNAASNLSLSVSCTVAGVNRLITCRKLMTLVTHKDARP